MTEYILTQEQILQGFRIEGTFLGVLDMLI